MSSKVFDHFNKRQVARSFNKAASSYDKAAVLQREVGGRLLERLQYVLLQPKTILDAGCGTGHFTRLLQKNYRGSHIYALDIAEHMVHHCAKQKAWFAKQSFVCADLENIPLADDSIDLVFSNLTLQWCENLPQVFAEIQRVLSPTGLLMFTTFGPDTLTELRQSWAQVDGEVHVHQFVDMHDIGDALVQSHFSQPVMDMENFTLHYSDCMKLMHDLQAIGAVNKSSTRRKTLTGKSRIKKLTQAYENFRNEQDLLPVTYEVVYGHAWGTDYRGGVNDNSSGVFTFRDEDIK